MQLVVNQLSYSYRKNIVLDSVSFEVKRGEIVGLLGVNGAGKSTLFRLLTGILRLQSGEILFDGQPLDRWVRRKLGAVFQECSLDPKLTGRENLILAAALYGKTEVPNFLPGVDLLRPVKELSGGMKRKLELARVFLHEPSIALLDEPTSGLDLKAFEDFWENLRQSQVTALVNTHKVEEAERCDRLLILHHGKIIVSETPEELKRRVESEPEVIRRSTPGLREAFLKVTGVELS
ncbi:MAG: ABC transporter ATP-binding protein [Myxococcaceae bacterium]|nr:ABC transporter ATP-binding protein [Myxococcaceae bacterium]MBH2006056.1 ABC transporter ATP-binding protein [Myxococcaceae bacterium]